MQGTPQIPMIQIKVDRWYICKGKDYLEFDSGNEIWRCSVNEHGQIKIEEIGGIIKCSQLGK